MEQDKVKGLPDPGHRRGKALGKGLEPRVQALNAGVGMGVVGAVADANPVHHRFR